MCAEISIIEIVRTLFFARLNARGLSLPTSSAPASATTATWSSASGPTASAAGPRTGAELPAKGETASLRAVQRMRPARNETVVCTGMRLKGGVQHWGDLATSPFVERKRD